MYTSIVSCNVKKNKFCSSTWSTDPVTQQPVSSVNCVGYRHRLSSASYHPAYSSVCSGGGDGEDEDGEGSGPCLPLPQMDGVPTGLEFLIDLSQLVVKNMVELFDVMKPHEINHHKLLQIVNQQNQRIYFAAVTSVPRENCCDVQRKFKVSIVDYLGRTVLVFERPYSCMLDATNNCWICCCWCGTIGGTLSVKLPDGTTLGEIQHTFACYRPMYLITDSSGVLMRIKGSPCGDCCNVLRSGLNCNHTEFHVTNQDSSQFIGVIKKRVVMNGGDDGIPDVGFGVNFPKNLGLKWKALLFGALFMIDFMYFENGRTSGF